MLTPDERARFEQLSESLRAFEHIPDDDLMREELNRLQNLLRENLNSKELETVQRCWDPIPFSGQHDPVVNGLPSYAWGHRFGDTKQPAIVFGLMNHAKGHRFRYEFAKVRATQPHLVKDKFSKLARDIRSVTDRIQHLSPGEWEFVERSVDLQSIWNLVPPQGQPLLELDALANALDAATTRISGQQKEPNEDLPLDYQLILRVETVVLARNGNVNQVLPIARIVRWWATNEKPGQTWGKDFYKQHRGSISGKTLKTSSRG